MPKAEQDEARRARRRRCCRSSSCSTASPASFPAASASASPWAARWCAIPLLFLFDEPLSNLDAKLRVEMRTEIKKLHQRLGKTTVYVTHDQVEAMTLASRIAVMHQGRAAAVRRAARGLRAAGQHVRRRLHGLAGDEFPSGRTGRSPTAGPASRCRATAASRPCCRSPAASGARPAAGRQVVLGIRPENIDAPRSGAARPSRGRRCSRRRSRWSSRPAPRRWWCCASASAR